MGDRKKAEVAVDFHTFKVDGNRGRLRYNLWTRRSTLRNPSCHVEKLICAL